MLTKSITISDKGQIAIPKEFVKYLGSKVIKLEIVSNNEVRMIPVKDVGGSLTNFAKENLSSDFNDIRTKAWDQITKEKFTKE
jgi:bifunctional DNA-binding transcriptional regulator/antitoxin component of YhaV-PrlF toxin-antitoxin module